MADNDLAVRTETRVTQGQAESAARTLGLPEKRIRKASAKARMGQYLAGLGETRLGHGDLEVATEILEQVMKDINRCLTKARKDGDTELILQLTARKIDIANSLMRSAALRIATQEAATAEMPRYTGKVFPPGVAIGINIAKDVPAEAKVLELPPATAEPAG